MSKEKQRTADENKPEGTLSEARKSALLRYLAILFAFAFLLVVVSWILQMRTNNATILELNRTSSSALSNAESLQEENRQLQEKNESLQKQLDTLTRENDSLKQDLETLQQGAMILTEKGEEATDQLDAVARELEQTKLAYEALITAEECDVREGNVTYSRAIETVEQYKTYLGQKALEEYQSMLLEDQQEEKEHD